MVKGYPIGTFIFWLTRERLRSVKELENAKLPPAKKGETVSFVLDGQQRLTSLFAAMKGLEIVRESGQQTDFSEIYIDLSAGESDTIATTDITETMKTHLIGDLDEFGILDDDYETFIQRRSKAISKQLKKRIIKRRVDDFCQAQNMYDAAE